MLYIILISLLKIPLWLLMRPKICGHKENLRMKGGVIFVCNHRALMDPVKLAVICPRIIHFMAKKELFDTKLGSIFFKSLFVFPVSRKTADIKSVKNAIKLLEKGKAFGIYPEGKRAVTDNIDDIEKGTAFIAAKSGAPIVPIYLKEAKHRLSRVEVMVGEVITVESASAVRPDMKPVEAVTEAIRSSLEELGLEMRKK